MRGRRAKSLIKVFPVESCQRIAEEFVNPDSFAFSFFEGILAEMPAMEVQGLATVAELRDPDRIKPAGTRLPK